MTRRLLVIPPHADFTASPVPPPGFEVMDLARRFSERVLQPSFLEGTGQVRLRAAARLLGSADPHRALLAAAVALEGISAPPSPLGLTLDDIELRPGTTERSADAIAVAARADVPWAPELDAAAGAARRADVVRVELERDHQLPAALALLSRVERAEVTGRFAARHRERLWALEAFRGCSFVDGFVEREVEGVRWRGSAEEPVPAGPWAGYVSEEELREPERLAGCARAVVPFVAAGPEGVTGVSGRAVEALRRRGVVLVGEWWVGAPGVGMEALERSVEPALASFDWIAALRPFSFPRGGRPDRWRGVQLRPGAVDATRDLLRTEPFEAEGTLTGAAREGAFDRLFAALVRHRPLVPGRVARAYAALPAISTDHGRVAVDPDAAVVPGDAGSGVFVNLRTGVSYPLDPLLVSLLSSLSAPVAVAEALPAAAPAQREALLGALIARGLVVRC